MAIERIRKQVTTPIFKVSYPHFDKPSTPPVRPNEAPKPGEYECVAIFNDYTRSLDAKYASQTAVTLDMMEKIVAAITVKVNGEGFIPQDWKTPIKDGREKGQKKDAALYAGSKFMRLHNKDKVQCLDANKTVLDTADRSKCYGGMYGRAIVTFADFDNIGKGVTVYLDAFQKIEDGEPIGVSAINAVSAFDDISQANPAQAVTSDDLASIL